MSINPKTNLILANVGKDSHHFKIHNFHDCFSEAPSRGSWVGHCPFAGNLPHIYGLTIRIADSPVPESDRPVKQRKGIGGISC
jgi:hypothetical protein